MEAQVTFLYLELSQEWPQILQERWRKKQRERLSTAIASYTSTWLTRPIPHMQHTYAAIQILFVPERHHWIATHYSGGEVLLYDSCFPGTLSPSTEEQL